jgi:hypothetical protein
MSFRILYGVNTVNIGFMTCSTVCSKGTPVSETGDGTNVVQPTPCGNPLGFLLEDVTSDGPSYEELELLKGVDFTEVKSGSKVTINDGEGELVTSLVHTTGTRRIALASVNIGSQELTVFNGYWGKALSGDVVCGLFMETDYDGVSGDYRIRRISPYVKA